MNVKLVLLGEWSERTVGIDSFHLLLGGHVAVQETRMIHIQYCDEEFEL